MLIEDKKLKDFFTDEQIKTMSEAVEDHRLSMETEPRSKMHFNDEKYRKYLDDITDLASNSDKFRVEIKRMKNGIKIW